MEYGIENMPQDIGLTECENQTGVAMAKHMLEAKKLEKSLWAEAAANVIYTLNCCSMRALRSVTHEETWSQRRPRVAHIRVFGSIVYATILDEKRGKLDVKKYQMGDSWILQRYEGV